MTEPADAEVALPPLQTALLDEATLGRLFDDVRNLGGPLEVVVKWAPGEHTPPGNCSLTDARQAFAAHRAFGIQLRYPLDGCLWMDTLMRVAEGVRLVRIAHPLEASDAALGA